MNYILKYLSFITLATIPFVSAFAAYDEIVDNVSVLPTVAQSFLKNNFSGAKVLAIGIDREISKSEYDVFLSDSTSISFNSSGEWTSIKNKKSGIPSSILTKRVLDYISASNFPSKKIVGISVKKSGVKVKLQYGVELCFKRDGTFIGLDD